MSVRRPAALAHSLDEGPATRALPAATTTDELDDPVVLLDQVDAKVAGQLLPVLRGQPYPLGDQDWARSPTGQLIATRAGPAMSLGVVDRTRLAAVLSALGALPTPDLRSAAAATWGDLFGTKLVRLVDAAP